MKSKLFLILLLALGAGSIMGQSKKDVLTNQKIIQLSDMGLSSSSIVTKIKNSQTNFDVSTAALIELKGEGVNGDVINEMINAESKQNSQSSSQKDMSDPLVMHRRGIYYYNPSNASKPLRRVDPAVISGGQSGGFGQAVASHYTYGLAKSSAKSSLPGPNSRFQIAESNPEFYFYFDANSESSPNEYVLVKLVEKKDSREMIVGAANAYGSFTGIPQKVKVPFDYSEEADNIYKMTFKTPLQKGEYCFLYAGSSPSLGSNEKVFDFGISK